MMKAATFALLACCAAAPAVAQQAPASPARAPQAGPQATRVDSLARVRVTQNFLKPRRLVGDLTGADTADLTVQRGTERLTVPLAYIDRVELAAARRSTTSGAARGAVYGFLGGATATGLLVLIVKASGAGCDGCPVSSPGDAAALFGLPLTGISTVTGAALGALRPGDEWVRITLPVSFRP